MLESHCISRNHPRFIKMKLPLASVVGLAFMASAFSIGTSAAQTRDLIKGKVLDGFQPVTEWRGVAEVAAVEGKSELTLQGDGAIVVNGPTTNKSIPHLVTKEEFRDVRVELEFMIPRNSNAGVYMMGRYEAQILDSYGKQHVGSGDLGGIYQRWDPSLPLAKQGFGGTAPRANAAKAPGEWQSMEIVFRAPRFSEDGEKVRDATFEKVLVNGMLVQENATSDGPTRSAPMAGDAATGPIAIQGDHGPIAIRKFLVTPLADPEVARLAELDAYWAEVSRSVKAGDFAAYQAGCHEKAVLVSGTKRISYPLNQALARWKKEFDDTRAGQRESSVEFRFAHRFGDTSTAHESGFFLYSSRDAGDEAKQEYVEFEALLVREQGAWKILMEYQKAKADKAAWDALAPRR